MPDSATGDRERFISFSWCIDVSLFQIRHHHWASPATRLETCCRRAPSAGWSAPPCLATLCPHSSGSPATRKWREPKLKKRKVALLSVLKYQLKLIGLTMEKLITAKRKIKQHKSPLLKASSSLSGMQSMILRFNRLQIMGLNAP